MLLLSHVDPRKETTSGGPILTPSTKHPPSSALGSSQNQAKWELLPAELSAGHTTGSWGDGPRVTRSSLGKDRKQQWNRSHEAPA